MYRAAGKKKYVIYLCKQCNNDFIAAKGGSCPKCRKSEYVEHIRVLWSRDIFSPQRKRWTNDDMENLKVMYHAGYSMSEIAKELDRSIPAVRQAIVRQKKKGGILYERKN